MAKKKKKELPQSRTSTSLTDTEKKKLGSITGDWTPPWWIYAAIMFFAVYLGIVVAGEYEKGDTFYSLLPKILNVLAEEPFKPKIGVALSNPLQMGKCLLVTVFIAFFIIVLDLSKDRTYMRGKEYGTARWGSIAAINKKFADKEFDSHNRVYSQRIRISQNPKYGTANNHCLVMGGSGAGK